MVCFWYAGHSHGTKQFVNSSLACLLARTSLLWLDGIARFHPGVKAAVKRMHILETVI